MIRTEITLKTDGGTAVLQATNTLFLPMMSMQVTNFDRFEVGTTPVVIDTEAESMDFTFLAGKAGIKKGSDFALVGTLTATIQLATGDIIITGPGKWLAASGCQIVRK